jgi:outer membrane protein assembly factor BamB
MAWGLRALLAVCALLLAACGHAAATGSGATGSGSAGTVSGAASAITGAGSRATASGAQVADADWPTFDFNAQRSGVGPTQTGITARNLGQLQLRVVTINGIADSSAIDLHGVAVRGRRRDVIVVTTSYGKTIAIDPGTGARLWEFVPRGVNSRPGNPQVTTASPVADPDGRFVYAASPNGMIHKLSLATGRRVWSRRVTLDPRHEKLASALNLSGRYVVVVTGGYLGDIPPYDGHVLTINRFTGRIAHVWNSECSNRHLLIRASSCSVTNTNGDNAIWSRGGAVIEPGKRRILVATGNGPFNGRDNWGDSVLELSPDAGRLLHSWTPTNQHQLDESDTDLGSAAPALLPIYAGLRLAVQAGKDGLLHLLNLGRLNGTRGGAGPRLGGELSQTRAPGGGQILTAPAVWSDAGKILVLVGDDSGTAAYRLVGGRHPDLQVVWQDGAPSTSPVVAGGLLYDYDEVNGRLIVRQPVSGVALRTLPVAQGHWNSPIVAGGRIILPTGAYHDGTSTSRIEIYHLPGS